VVESPLAGCQIFISPMPRLQSRILKRLVDLMPSVANRLVKVGIVSSAPRVPFPSATSVNATPQILACYANSPCVGLF
jgi:hypothetical protein